MSQSISDLLDEVKTFSYHQACDVETLSRRSDVVYQFFQIIVDRTFESNRDKLRDYLKSLPEFHQLNSALAVQAAFAIFYRLVMELQKRTPESSAKYTYHHISLNQRLQLIASLLKLINEDAFLNNLQRVSVPPKDYVWLAIVGSVNLAESEVKRWFKSYAPLNSPIYNLRTLSPKTKFSRQEDSDMIVEALCTIGLSIIWTDPYLENYVQLMMKKQVTASQLIKNKYSYCVALLRSSGMQQQADNLSTYIPSERESIKHMLETTQENKIFNDTIYNLSDLNRKKKNYPSYW